MIKSKPTHTIFAAILSAALLSVATAPTFAADRIDTKQEFLDKIAERRISDPNENTWMVATKNGRLNGEYRGLKIRGKWRWGDGFWCRSARVGVVPIPSECQEITLANQKLILRRKNGTGSSHTYMIR